MLNDYISKGWPIDAAHSIPMVATAHKTPIIASHKAACLASFPIGSPRRQIPTLTNMIQPSKATTLAVVFGAITK